MSRHKRAVNKFTSEDRWFSAIGRFIFEFSQLEYTLKHHIAEAVGLNEAHVSSIMTHDFAMLCNIADAILLQESKVPDGYWDGLKDTNMPRGNRVKKDYQVEITERADKLKKLIKECKQLNDDRVRVVHGLWYVGGDRVALYHVSRQKLKHSTYFQQADDLASKADTACRLRNEIPNVLYSFTVR
jgi:hypothetical protein